MLESIMCVKSHFYQSLSAINWTISSEYKTRQIEQLSAVTQVFFVLQVTSDGEVVVTWEDDHVSSFSHDWLREYGFTADKQQERETNLSLPLVLWNNATMQDKVPKFKFDDVSFWETVQ